jgi:hypothetical protein
LQERGHISHPKDLQEVHSSLILETKGDNILILNSSTQGDVTSPFYPPSPAPKALVQQEVSDFHQKIHLLDINKLCVLMFFFEVEFSLLEY